MRTLGILTGILAVGLLPVLGTEKLAMTKVDEAEKSGLAKRVAAISAVTSELIGRAQTVVERYPTPFFKRGAVYLVSFSTASGPKAFTVGVAGADAAVMLQSNADGFFQLAEKAQMSLTSNADKTAYGMTFLEATRDFRTRFQILQRASDIQIIAQPTTEEQARYRQLEEKYQTVIHAPQISATATELRVYALVGQDLDEITLTFEEHGHLKRTDQVLEKSLPIGYAR